MARSPARSMSEYRHRKRAQGLKPVQLWAYDLGQPDVQDRLRREADLVRGHPSTVEANQFLAEIIDELTY